MRFFIFILSNRNKIMADEAASVELSQQYDQSVISWYVFWSSPSTSRPLTTILCYWSLYICWLLWCRSVKFISHVDVLLSLSFNGWTSDWATQCQLDVNERRWMVVWHNCFCHLSILSFFWLGFDHRNQQPTDDDDDQNNHYNAHVDDRWMCTQSVHINGNLFCYLAYFLCEVHGQVAPHQHHLPDVTPDLMSNDRVWLIQDKWSVSIGRHVA